MSEPVFILVLAASCFTALALVRIRVTDGLEVPAAAALAPVVGFAALDATSGSPTVVLLACAAGVIAVVAVVGRRVGEPIRHASLLLVSGALLAVFSRSGAMPRLAAASAASLVYALGFVDVRVLKSSAVRRDNWTWLVLVALVVCAGGLTSLVLPRLGWATFPAMTVVLAITKREFDAFAESRLAFDQTVAALERLKSLSVNQMGDAPSF